MQPSTMTELAESVGSALSIPALLADMIGQPPSVLRLLVLQAIENSLDLGRGINKASTNGEAACAFIGQVRHMLLQLVDAIDSHVRCSPVPSTAGGPAVAA